jgi:hypothetical protein
MKEKCIMLAKNTSNLLVLFVTRFCRRFVEIAEYMYYEDGVFFIFPTIVQSMRCFVFQLDYFCNVFLVVVANAVSYLYQGLKNGILAHTG